MFTMVAKSTRMAVSAVAAVAVVSFGGLVLDQAHIASAPRGTVEIGEIIPIESTLAMLPEITVVAKRESAAGSMLAAVELPEIVVSARRVAYVVAQAQAARSGQANAELDGSADGALLK